jgi:CBS domain-containing protein
MKKIRDIMTRELETAAPHTTLEEIATMMREEDVGSIPVVEDGKLIGIVTDRDIVVRAIAEGRDPSDTTAKEVLSQNLATATPDMDLERAARLMAERQVRRLPVVEGKKLLGIVSLGDIAVKEEGSEVSGEALERISEGVKSGSAPGGGNVTRQGALAEEEDTRARALRGEGRAQPKVVSARGRREGSAGDREQPSSKVQGIASRGAERKAERQERVSPARTGPTRSGGGRRTG